MIFFSLVILLYSLLLTPMRLGRVDWWSKIHQWLLCLSWYKSHFFHMDHIFHMSHVLSLISLTKQTLHNRLRFFLALKFFILSWSFLFYVMLQKTFDFYMISVCIFLLCVFWEKYVIVQMSMWILFALWFVQINLLLQKERVHRGREITLFILHPCSLCSDALLIYSFPSQDQW